MTTIQVLKPGQRVRLDGGSYNRDYGAVSDVPPSGKYDFPTVMIEVEGRFYNPQEVKLEWCTPVPTGMRDAVAGDLLNLAALKEHFEVPFEGFLWGQSHGMMTPYVAACSFGDGLRLLRLTTINSRPNYYVIRVDSGWDESNWSSKDNIGEHTDEILATLEEEVGNGSADNGCEDCPEGECDCDLRDWPALDDSTGCSWGFIDYPPSLQSWALGSALRTAGSGSRKA